MNLLKKHKLKFIKLIVSILIIMIVISQVESGLSLDVVFAAQQSFKADNATFYYDPDSNENCIYYYNDDKSKMIRCPLQTYAGKEVYYPEGYQKNNTLTIYTKDENTNKYTKSGEYSIDQAYTYMNVETGTLASFLGTGITPDTVNKELGITDSDKKAQKGTETDKEDDVTDKSKISNDYAKYSYDKDSNMLSVTYYDPNTNKIVTRTYSFNKNSNQFEMNNNDHNQEYYSDFVNNDEHNKAHKVQTAISIKNFENVTGISKDELPSYMEETTDEDELDKLIDGVAGVILYPAKVLPLLLGKAMETAMGLFTEDGTNLTLDEILFNKVEVLSVNFFDLDTKDTVVKKIRENVAMWYYGLRNLSAIILFVILIYTGLKMALTTIAEEKAKYSQMIVDWLVSIVLLFILHYLMQFIIIINNQIVEIFSKGLVDQKGETIDMVDQFFVNAWSVGFTEGVGSALAYLALVGMTFVFLLAYLKRMITTAFLIVIAPLVTITYSIDKMGDNKSQALNNWLKEFSYNILIQVFHCGSYLALVQSSMKILNKEKSLSAVVVSFIMIVFMYQAEKIIKFIFKINPESMSDTVGHAAYYATIMGNVGSFASGANNKYKNNNSITPKQENSQTKSTGLSSSTGKNGKNSSNTKPNSNSLRKINGNRINDAISAVTNNRLFQAGVTANKVASKMILGVGLAGATGDPTTIISAGANAVKNGMDSGRSYREDRNKHEMQQSYSGVEREAQNYILDEKVKQKMNLKDLNNLTDDQKTEANRYREQIMQDEGSDIELQAKEQVRTRAQDILNGSTPQTEAEQDLFNSMEKMKKTYKENGMSDKNINRQLSNDLVDIRAGKYREATNAQIIGKNIATKATNVADVIASPVNDVKKYYRKKHNSQS